jgi:hypothetical protein
MPPEPALLPSTQGVQGTTCGCCSTEKRVDFFMLVPSLMLAQQKNNSGIPLKANIKDVVMFYMMTTFI